MITASKLNLASRCLAWSELPCVYTSSEAATVGTQVHAWIEAKLTGQPLPELSSAAAAMLPQRAVDWLHGRLDDRCVYTLECERAYAASVDSAKPLEIKAREYPELPSGWLVGTADVVVGLDGRGWVMDWKTTQSHTCRSQSAGRACDNLQLRFLAHAAMQCNPRWDSCLVCLVHIGPHGELYDDWHSYSRFELELLAVDLFAMLAGSKEPRPGMHCHDMYCPAIASCPAHAGIMRPLVGDFALPQRASDIQSDAHAIWLYAQAKSAERAAKQLADMAKDYARAHNGAKHGKYSLVPVKSSRETIKGTNVGKLVEIIDKYAPGAGPSCVTVSSSKTDIERAIKAVAPRGKGASIIRECMLELEQAGYVSRAEFDTIKFEEEKEGSK